MTQWWKVVDDNSLRSERRPKNTGVEVVSPILSGQAGLFALERAVGAITTLNPEVNKSTGYHVHIDATDLKQAIDNGAQPVLRQVAVARRKADAALLAIKKICVAYIIYEPAFDLLTKRSRQQHENRLCQSCRSGDSMQDQYRQIQRIKRAATLREVVLVMNPPTRTSNGEPHRIYKLNLTNLVDGPNGRGHGTIEFRQYHGTVDATEARNWVELLQFFVHRVKKPEAEYIAQPPEMRTVAQLWQHMMYQTVQRKHLTDYYWNQIVRLDEQDNQGVQRIYRAQTYERRAVRGLAARLQQGVSTALAALRLREVPGVSEDDIPAYVRGVNLAAQ